MRNHLSDHDLVLALDGELPAGRQAVVHAHLLDCASCRARRAALDQASKRATALYRTESIEDERVETSRQELRQKLTAMARSRQASATERFQSWVLRTPRWALMTAAAAATILLIG